MPIETLRSNLIYLRKRNYLTQGGMGVICDSKTSAIGSMEQGHCIMQLPALKLISDHFEISIDDLVRTDISKHNQHDLFDYYISAKRSLNDGRRANKDTTTDR